MRRACTAAGTGLLVLAGCSLMVPGLEPFDGSSDGSQHDTFEDLASDQEPDGVDAPDLAVDCDPHARACLENDLYVCDEDGRGWNLEQECFAGQVCVDAEGCRTCTPGQRICLDGVSVMCDGTSEQWLSMRDCAQWGSTCVDGYCDDPCGSAELQMSNVGCEFWAAPLANPDTMASGSGLMTIHVTNPSGDGEAEVTVTRGTEYVDHIDVPPWSSISLDLELQPWVTSALPEGGWQSFFAHQAAYRVTSTRPVSVQQMIPDHLDEGTGTTTSGGSLLLPLHVLSNRYLGASVPAASANDPSGGGGERWASYMAVVAVAPGTTSVDVEPGMDMVGDSHGRFADVPMNGSTTFSMEQFEIVHLAAAVPPVCTPGEENHVNVAGVDYCYPRYLDPSNTTIHADQPVAVFGGAVQQRVPYHAEGPDHVQEQMPPLEALGRHFVTAPMVHPGEPVANRIRLVINHDGTNVTVSPEQDGFGSEVLGAGGTRELELTEPVEVDTDKPILLVQLLAGHPAAGPDVPRGDPAMTVIVPTEQQAQSHTFFAPPAFVDGTDAKTYVMVTRPLGAAVDLDEAFLEAPWWSVGEPGSGWEVGLFEISAGYHHITCDSPIGVHVYGLGDNAGFAHPAGTKLDFINLMSSNRCTGNEWEHHTWESKTLSCSPSSARSTSPSPTAPGGESSDRPRSSGIA